MLWCLTLRINKSSRNKADVRNLKLTPLYDLAQFQLSHSDSWALPPRFFQGLCHSCALYMLLFDLFLILVSLREFLKYIVLCFSSGDDHKTCRHSFILYFFYFSNGRFSEMILRLSGITTSASWLGFHFPLIYVS